MPAVDAKTVKALRDATGAGMMDCKKALEEVGGDLEKAKDALREKGLAGREKRAGRAAKEGQVHAYIHPGGKVGVLVEMTSETDFVAMNELFQELIHDVALHIAFANPEYLSRDEIPDDVIAKEREFVERQAKNEGKPDNIVPKIVEGRMASFFKDRCLLDQAYVRDDKKTIGGLVNDLAAKMGENIQVRRFARYEVGK